MCSKTKDEYSCGCSISTSAVCSDSANCGKIIEKVSTMEQPCDECVFCEKCNTYHQMYSCDQNAAVAAGIVEGEPGLYRKKCLYPDLEAAAYARLAGVPGICEFVAREEDKLILKRYQKNLSDHVTSGGQFEDKWISQLMGTLGEMHKRGVIHGDINPRNIMLDDQLNAVIADLDSCVIDGDYLKGGLNETKLGTPPWVSSRYNQTSRAEESDDYYSLGYTLWFCLTGIKPFKDVEPSDTDRYIADGHQESLEKVPVRYRELIRHLWNEEVASAITKSFQLQTDTEPAAAAAAATTE